jgi:hypothetical protein
MRPPLSLSTGSLAEAWRWAMGHWNVRKVPKQLNVRVSV